MSDEPAPGGPLGVRRAGVLLPVSSLPGGTLGPEAFAFVDFLAAAGCTVWQVLPLVPPHEDDGSPYNSLSVMAGDVALLDPARTDVLDEAGYTRWCARQADWLEPYVEFMAVRELQDRAPWPTWEPGLRDREPQRVGEVLAGAGGLVERLRRGQWRFAEQWSGLRAYASTRGVLLFGDLPIFVSHDSADVWATRHLFLLDREGQPVTVTGVPPDYFAVDGQRWNNPHYDWVAMAADGFSWWRRRIARQRELFDLVRIDHFRGFEAAWHVPLEAATAKEGWWVPGPGRGVVRVLVDEAGAGTLVAEDLGVITPEVEALRTGAGLPGMKVLQFAFDGSPDNPYLPAHHEPDSVVYIGTHDNDTALGWWSSLTEQTRAEVRAQLADPDEPMPWALVRLALSSAARLAVVPAQDLLGLGSESRMNTPGTDAGNWSWRASNGAFGPEVAARLRSLLGETDRLRERPGSPPAPAPRHGLRAKLVRYFTGSVVATLCSEIAFVLLYGALGVGTTWSSVLSWLAGAVPNFWLNRSWAWQRKGRPSLRAEVLPYVAIIVVTLVLATLTTHAVDRWLQDQGTAPSVRVALVAAVFLGVYVVVFAARFLLLERLFSRLPHHGYPTPSAAEELR